MTETYEAITKVNEKFSETFKNADAKGVADLYTEEGQLLPANSDFLTGRTAVQGFFQGLMDAGIHSIQLTTKEVEEFGETAVEIGRFVLRDANKQIVDEGKFIVVWKFEEEIWKLHRDIINSSLPA